MSHHHLTPLAAWLLGNLFHINNFVGFSGVLIYLTSREGFAKFPVSWISEGEPADTDKPQLFLILFNSVML